MLAPHEAPDTAHLKYPVLVSKKYDGFRCLVQNGVLVSRNLKPIVNKNVQAKFAGLPEGFDGELIVGDPTSRNEEGHSNAFRNTSTIVTAFDKPADDVKFYVFDQFHEEYGFEQRQSLMYGNMAKALRANADTNWDADVIMVTQVMIQNENELMQIEAAWLEEGYEGVMGRSIAGRYKQGRGTINESLIWKLKRFVDAEAVIIGTVEEQRNENLATTNALGRTQRGTSKAGMVGKGTLGKFLVRGINGRWDGVEFDCGGGLDGAERRDLWPIRESLVGKVIKYKWFSVGSADKPRFPIYLGFRDKGDM